MRRESAGRGSFDEATAPQKRTFLDWIRWADTNLPNEHPAFVANAAANVRYSGNDVTPAAVLAELERTGRARTQLNMPEFEL